MKEKNNQDIDFLFNLLTKHNFRDLIWNVAHESNDEIFKQKLLKIHNYWKPLLDGYHKFLLPPENELFISLKTAFDKLTSRQKFTIIQNNLKFGVFLKENEISDFLKLTTDNWKYFALTFVKNIENINLREFEINGSLNQIGRLLLKNKKIKNRKSKIQELYNKWELDLIHKNSDIYLSYKELNLLWEKIGFNWNQFLTKITETLLKSDGLLTPDGKDKFFPKKMNILKLLYIDQLKLLLKASNIKNKSNRKKILINLKSQVSKQAINSGEMKTWSLPGLNSQKIKEDIVKNKYTNPFAWIKIPENNQFAKNRSQFPLFDVFFHKPILYSRELNMPIEYYWGFSQTLAMSFYYYYFIMERNLKLSPIFGYKRSSEITRLNADFYYYLRQNDIFSAGMLAISFFQKTIIRLFPWMESEFQEKTCNFWNVCKIIKKYMSKDYQYFIDLTFFNERDETTLFLNARNRLFHFKQNFTLLHAFAIYTLAIENHLILEKVSLEYYKNWKFSKKDEIL